MKQHVSAYSEAIIRFTLFALRETNNNYYLSLRTNIVNLMMASEYAETCSFINTLLINELCSTYIILNLS